MKIDGGKNVCQVRLNYIELGEQFDFAAGNARIHVQLAGDGDEILLKHRQRNDAGSCPAMLGKKLDSKTLLGLRFPPHIEELLGLQTERNHKEENACVTPFVITILVSGRNPVVVREQRRGFQKMQQF